MDTLFQCLLIIHLLALVVGVATNVAMPVVMARMPSAAPETRAVLQSIGARLSLNARVALGVLLVSGPTMVLVRYGTFSGLSPWFHVKMLLVAVVFVGMVVSAVAKPGTINPKMMGMITRVSLIGIIVASVFAFN